MLSIQTCDQPVQFAFAARVLMLRFLWLIGAVNASLALGPTAELRLPEKYAAAYTDKLNTVFTAAHTKSHTDLESAHGHRLKTARREYDKMASTIEAAWDLLSVQMEQALGAAVRDAVMHNVDAIRHELATVWLHKMPSTEALAEVKEEISNTEVSAVEEKMAYAQLRRPATLLHDELMSEIKRLKSCHASYLVPLRSEIDAQFAEFRQECAKLVASALDHKAVLIRHQTVNAAFHLTIDHCVPVFRDLLAQLKIIRSDLESLLVPMLSTCSELNAAVVSWARSYYIDTSQALEPAETDPTVHNVLALLASSHVLQPDFAQFDALAQRYAAVHTAEQQLHLHLMNVSVLIDVIDKLLEHGPLYQTFTTRIALSRERELRTSFNPLDADLQNLDEFNQRLDSNVKAAKTTIHGFANQLDSSVLSPAHQPSSIVVHECLSQLNLLVYSHFQLCINTIDYVQVSVQLDFVKQHIAFLSSFQNAFFRDIYDVAVEQISIVKAKLLAATLTNNNSVQIEHA